MSVRSLRRSAAVLAGCVAVLGPAGVAQASDTTLRAAVKRGVPQIIRSQAMILNGLATYQQTHSVTRLIKAINAQDRTLRALQAKVAKQAPSSATGRRARTDIVAGLQLIVVSNTALVGEIRKQAAGQTVSKAHVKAAQNGDAKGNRDLNAGAKLLKL